MWYRCTRSHPINDSNPCSLGVIADARVTKAAYHTPESANQICFPPFCSVLPSHTPAHWLHRCMCTLWHPENMHALGTCAKCKFSWSCGHACCEIRTHFTFLNCSLIWCDWCTLKTSYTHEYDCDSVNIHFEQLYSSRLRSLCCIASSCACFDIFILHSIFEPPIACLHGLPGTLSWTCIQHNIALSQGTWFSFILVSQ